VIDTEVELPVASLLLVDDRPDNLLTLEAVLEPLGLRLVRANSGEEALRWLLTDDFALIILDVQMPGLDGFETARHIKARDKTRQIPIIFLTALSTDANHELEGYGTGAVDYVSKPFDPQVLRTKVAVLVELRQQAKLIEEQKALLALRLVERDRAQAALIAQATELERSNAELDRFASVLSHDLTEPLHVVAGYLDLLRDRYGDDLRDGGGALLEKAQEGTDRLYGLIDQLLLYAQASTGLRATDRVALGDALDDARHALASEIADSGAEITHDPLPTIVGDRWQLALLFTHLLQNSIEFAGDVGPDIHVGLSRREDSWVIAVRDKGSGISADRLPQLFTMFGRQARSDGHGGMGLAIARRIVERHGGTIWAESVADLGTTVSFTVPVNATGPA
jgi:signal transduction histidine kinase